MTMDKRLELKAAIEPQNSVAPFFCQKLDCV
jgi:hypothetical protein